MKENAKTLVIDAATENCDIMTAFSERDIFEETRLQLESVDACRYVPEYEDGKISEEEAVGKIMDSLLKTGRWESDEEGYESEFEVEYIENYPLYGSPAITVKYWAFDNSLDRWTTVYISLPEK